MYERSTAVTTTNNSATKILKREESTTNYLFKSKVSSGLWGVGEISAGIKFSDLNSTTKSIKLTGVVSQENTRVQHNLMLP